MTIRHWQEHAVFNHEETIRGCAWSRRWPNRQNSERRESMAVMPAIDSKSRE